MFSHDSQGIEKGHEERYSQDADYFSIPRGKAAVEGFFYWNLLSEPRAGHAKHPSSYRGNLTTQHELHALSGFLKPPCLNTFYSKHGLLSSTSVFGGWH